MASTLIIGDIVGDEALQFLGQNLAKLKQKYSTSTIIVNGENAFNGKGIAEKQILYLQQLGVKVITSGNHIWNHATKNVLDSYPNFLLRPDNYYAESIGSGVAIIDTSFAKLAVINLIGQSFMAHQVINPFHHIEKLLKEIRIKTKNIIVDFHAETTSEKIAMKWFLDGKVTCLVGTHTHVQTRDAEISDAKTAYITDLGMTGPYNSVIGMEKDAALNRFLTGLPTHYKLAEGDLRISGVYLEYDEDTGHAKKIDAFQYKSEELNLL